MVSQHSDNNLLNIENIFKSYGKKQVLEDISFSVNKGEIFGLIGLNGAGKTTLIKIILGLLSQDSGSATLFGESVHDIQTRKKLSFLPEKFHPSRLLKGREFLSLTLSYYGKEYDHDQARQLVKKLDLDPDVLDLKMTKYSKGMGQKIGLASAFLTQSPLLLLDEPMSGLDPSARIHLKDTLLNYTKETDNTIFFSSHILSDIDEICDNIAVIHNRKLIFAGKPDDFKTQYNIDNLERAFLQAIAA